MSYDHFVNMRVEPSLQTHLKGKNKLQMDLLFLANCSKAVNLPASMITFPVKTKSLKTSTQGFYKLFISAYVDSLFSAVLFVDLLRYRA